MVRDDSGAPLNTHRATTTVRVNAAPIADAGPDLIAAPGEEVVLDGSGSVDPDDAIADWTWRFPDGSEAHGRRVAHTFATSGLQRVQLTVRDDTGLPEAFDVDELVVAVNAPPVAAAGADLSVEPGAAGPPRRQRLLRPGRRHHRLALGLRRPRRARPRPHRRAHLRRPGRPHRATHRRPTRAAPPTPPPPPT